MIEYNLTLGHRRPAGLYVFSGASSSPSPPTEGGEGWAVLLAGAPGCQQWNSPLPVRSSRGEGVRFALNTYAGLLGCWPAGARPPRPPQSSARAPPVGSLTGCPCII